MQKKEYYTTGDVARLSGYHYTTVQTWIQARKIRAKKIGGWWRIPRSEVEKILKEKLNLTDKEVEKLLGLEEDKKGH